jgi:hypothetical protein
MDQEEGGVTSAGSSAKARYFVRGLPIATTSRSPSSRGGRPSAGRVFLITVRGKGVVIRPRQPAWIVHQCFLVKGQVWSPSIAGDQAAAELRPARAGPRVPKGSKLSKD